MFTNHGRRKKHETVTWRIQSCNTNSSEKMCISSMMRTPKETSHVVSLTIPTANQIVSSPRSTRKLCGQKWWIQKSNDQNIQPTLATCFNHFLDVIVFTMVGQNWTQEIPTCAFFDYVGKNIEKLITYSLLWNNLLVCDGIHAKIPSRPSRQTRPMKPNHQLKHHRNHRILRWPTLEGMMMTWFICFIYFYMTEW